MGVETAVEKWRTANGCGLERTAGTFNEKQDTLRA